MSFPKSGILTMCFIFCGFTCCCCGASNGTTNGVKTILKGILFECSHEHNRKLNGDIDGKSYLAISIKTDPSLHIDQLHQFLTLDEIYVANRFSTDKLVAPYVIEIIRGQPLMMCPLEREELEYMNSEFNSLSDATNQQNFIAKSAANEKLAKTYYVSSTNLPIPILVTTVNIFQKRYSTWWKLAPSVTLDSYTGFYANHQLSVWFKYHMNIFQLTKSVNRIKQYKFLIPIQNQLEQQNDFKTSYLDSLEKSPIVPNMLENCPHNSSILCINVLDDVVAGYTLKIRLPFLENAFVPHNVFKVKIINVITDATVKDMVKVFVNLVNEGFQVHEFAVNFDCLEEIRINETFLNSKKLLPHVGETLKFLLPFIFKSGSRAGRNSFCKIQIQALAANSLKRDLNQQKYKQSVSNYRTVATRKITVSPHQRCFCVWTCSCHCLDKLETNVDNFKACQELDSLSQSKAGLLTNSNYYELNNEEDLEGLNYVILRFILDCFWLAILIIAVLLWLGLCKAIIGICIAFVDKWGYDYLQPGRKYVDSSKWRHFWINLFYFILLPFLICCNCFTPSVEDLVNSDSENCMTKMYMHVYEVFYDDVSTVIIVEEAATSLQTDDY